jgi:hypothetical protein
MVRKRTRGTETWTRLREWTDGQSAAERLSAQLLRMEQFHSVDPIHPLGGRDGLKDIVCKRGEKTYIVAAHFPRGQHSFTEIRKKFLADLRGVAENKADGIVFITNQELRDGERKKLKSLAEGADTEIFHLERVASILDSPSAYGIRLEYLDIEMSKEEQLALLSEKDRLLREVKSNTELIISLIKDNNILNYQQRVDAVQTLEATRFLIEENNWNRGYYRDLIKELYGSLDAAMPILIRTKTFEEFIEQSVGSKPVIREFSDDWVPDWARYFKYTRAMAFGRPMEKTDCGTQC